MAGLVQGVLENNSVTPDVDIQEFTSDSAREHLKNAMDKSCATDRKVVGCKIKVRGMGAAQSCVLKKQKLEGNLAFEVAKLSSKMDNFEKNTKLFEQNQREERTLELEKRMNKITDERLQYLEKLQHEQEQWKSQYFNTIKKLNDMQGSLVTKPAPVPRATTTESKQSLLETPLPRKIIPQPTSSAQLGKGQFLRDILDQYNASTPNLSRNVDTIPVRLNEEPPVWNHSKKVTPVAPPSPIKPSASELIAKEIENEAERKQISEKFPNSISEYLPMSTITPVSHLLTKTIPSSSLVSEFRGKLRKLIEMRANLENNLRAVQGKPKLTDVATATLLQQVDDDCFLSAQEEKLCWIKKLVDEEIALNMVKVKEDVAAELMENKKKKSAKPYRLAKKSESNKPPSAKKGILENKKKAVKQKPAIKKRQSQYDDADESVVTHVYGKAEYHPHRTTVHKPFMHVVSPIKSPKFRTKRALQAVPANYVRSEKTQTRTNFDTPTILRSKYLAPTAISLGPPQIHENDLDPIVVPAAKPVVVVPKSPCPLKKIEIIQEPDELPGNETLFDTCNLDASSCEEEVQLDGEGGHKFFSASKPVSSPCKRKSPLKVRCKSPEQPKEGNICAQEKMKCWIEQEIMSRILSQLYPAATNQETQTVNLQTDTMKKLIEDEIQAQIRQRLLQRVKPKAPEPVLSSPQIVTPLPTPQPTPTPSISEKSEISHHSVKTPSLSAESSVVETEVEPSSLAPSPEVTASHEEEIIHLPTPQKTPVPSPTVSVVVSEKNELEITDPWEGKNPEEVLQLIQSPVKLPQRLAPEPELTDLVVRTLTPPPPPKARSLTSSESSSSDDSLRTDDKTISEGQLVIEHGEMRLRKKKPIKMPENMDDLLDQNTLRDVADLEPISEGELRKTRAPIIPTRFANVVLDDPTDIYARPRKPAATSDHEDLSVGEIPGKKRKKFNKWKASKQSPGVSPSQVRSTAEEPLSVNDLDSTSVDSPSVSMELAPNVIMVTSATPRASHTHQGGSEEFGKSDNFVRDSLDDPQVKSRNPMTLTIPSTDPLSGASDTDDISVQDY